MHDCSKTAGMFGVRIRPLLCSLRTDALGLKLSSQQQCGHQATLLEHIIAPCRVPLQTDAYRHQARSREEKCWSMCRELLSVQLQARVRCQASWCLSASCFACMSFSGTDSLQNFVDLDVSLPDRVLLLDAVQLHTATVDDSSSSRLLDEKR